jgi:hypothetical protein
LGDKRWAEEEEEEETDDERRKRHMRNGAIGAPPAVFALVCVARLVCWRGIYKMGVKHGKEAPLDLPKGIVLSPQDLALQLQGSPPAKGAGAQKVEGKELTGEWSGFTECEVCIADEQKGSVYVFDANSAGETYVVVEVRGCTSGPPLLPTRMGDASLRWVAPDDRYMHLSTYLALAMKRLTGKDWSQRILPHMSGNYLVRYQAAVREEHWRELWDVLMKPFNEQRSEYRRKNDTHRAPDMFFGVKARTCQPEKTPDAEPDVSTVASDGKESDEASDGIPLPRAAEWLEYWQQTAIPTQRTFIEFASHISETGMPRRSPSAPDLSRLADDKEA